MKEVENRGSIFISYAWGNGLENKAWVRQRIVTSVNWNHDVFWDRDSIAYGESVDGVIAKALTKRPILILCLCDQDYVKAAQQGTSGLHRELQMLAKICDEPGVRIVPLILEAGCTDKLPEPLVGRLYLNLQPLHQLNIDIGMAVMGVTEGLTPAQVQNGINSQLAAFKLRQRALNYLRKHPVTVWGNGRNHEVTVYRQDTAPHLLHPPQWMWESANWNYMLNDDGPTFCPTKGRWHWELSSSSTDMRPLATALLSTFFEQLTGEDVHLLLDQGGIVLANTFFRTVMITEPFSFDAEDIVGFLMRRDEGYEALEKLLNAVDLAVEVAY
ncbi:toll/interleukin-1 receptor domain-containing protein [Pseudomonas syringae]|uniref:toll/interleukin-1 receptor domain-containing protein n=1 Tax=Pseudomonas syringae TaxID=317 RepID=UPI0011D0A624|nr:toll/interleukin-1 receptor domain-containing protein [Pseudomonas syringae]